MPKDYYSQPDAPDPVLDNAVVLELVRRHVPSAKEVTGVDETGGEARTYAVDAGLILKTQRPQQLRPRTSLSKERFFLNQIAADLPDLSVPRVLGGGREGRYIEYSVLTRMPGIALRNAALSADARLDVTRELGRSLRRIHRLPQAPYADNPLFPGDRSADDVRRRVADQLAELVARINSADTAWSLPLTPAEVAARALACLPDRIERVALHSNPWHEHTFVDPVSGKYSGLIDFGDAFISHPALDLRRWRIRSEREALLEGYTADGPVGDEFLAAWRVAQVLGDMGAISNSPALAAAAQVDLGLLLETL